jgi:hypothetical protein
MEPHAQRLAERLNVPRVFLQKRRIVNQLR